jgi:LuxR family maltose regulon positive regulatory protein
MRIPSSTIALPELPAAVAPRPHLVELLDRAEPGKLVMVVAPPGYGKTVVLSQWMRSVPQPRVAWVSLDRTFDADRFRSALRAALAAVPGLPTDHPLRTPAGAGADVDELVAALEDVRPTVSLVLDDLHELTDPEALLDLERLVRRRPAGLRLVLAGRRDPPLPVARLRAEGRTHELRAEHLRFTPAETKTLMRASGLDLTPRQLAALQTRTGGWVAGLRFAATALRSADDPQRFVDRFSGSEQSMADYLAGEVMASLPAGSRDLLRVGSVCAQLPVGLAIALSGRQDAAELLDELAGATGLADRLDATTYRVHPLLRSYLGTELERHLPARFRQAHITAAWWWLAAGDPAHALQHAERAGEPELGESLLPAVGLRLVATGGFAAVRRLLDGARGTSGPMGPWALLLEAVVEYHQGSGRAARAALEQAGRGWPAEPEPALARLRHSLELLLTGHASTPDPGPAGETPEQAQLAALCRAAVTVARPDLAPDRVRPELEQLVLGAREHGFGCFEAWAWMLLAVLEHAAGRYRAMALAARSALTAATIHGHPEYVAAAVAAVATYADLLAADPLAARDRAAAALGAQPGGDGERVLRVLHAVARSDLGEPVTRLARCRSALVELDAPAAVLAAVAVLEHRVALAHTGVTGAARTTEWLRERVGPVAEVRLTEAWAHLAAGRHDAAGEAAEEALAGPGRALVAHTPVEARLVLAECALHREDAERARAEVVAALADASRLEVLRPAALADGALGELVESVAGEGTDPRLYERIVAARAVVRRRPRTVLSDRERAVLALLPSLLSAAEIADELTVSVNTVKTHIRSIYTKLGVSSRRDAVARARERDLLP